MVQGSEDGEDTALELKSMGLSDDDQLDALTCILEKPQYVATFKSVDNSLRETFVKRILREVRND